jgi:hypothetical protein
MKITPIKNYEMKITPIKNHANQKSRLSKITLVQMLCLDLA